MSVEILDIKEFIHSCSPMEKLSDEDLQILSLAVEIIYQRHGSVITPTANKTPCIYLLRSGAVEVKNNQQELINQLDSGNWFGYEHLFDENASAAQFEIIEDSLIYVIPLDVIKPLTEKNKAIQAFFSIPLLAYAKLS